MKVAALFIGTFLTVFLGLLCWDLFLMLGERVLVDRAVAENPPVTAIDPKLESDLVKVLEYSDVQNTADIKNPFADQSGISNRTTTPVSTSAPQSASVRNVNPAASQNNAQRSQAQQQQSVPGRTVQPDSSVNPQPQLETKARLQLRDEKIRLGMDGGPEAMVFSVDDLLPVGRVSGGDGKEEVLFYSQTACRVVSFPVGTQFFDGLLESLRPEGVVFRYYDQFRFPGMRQWETSTVSKCSEKVSELPRPEQAVTAGGGD